MKAVSEAEKKADSPKSRQNTSVEIML